MKLSSFLSPLLFLSGTSAITTHVHRNLGNDTDLSNGAVLGVDIALPAVGSSFRLAPNATSRSVHVKGSAQVGKGTPDVAYIYIIDSSGSTDDWDGACGSTLDCVQAFFEELHTEVTSDGSAELVAVIDFDDQAHITASFQDPNSPQITTAIQQGYPDGGTACSHALETATLLVHQQKTAGTTVVIFAGDGQCNGGDEGATVVGENVTDSANLLGDTGAIVHSIAVGENVDCTPGNDLQNIPRNGGKCFSIPEPKALPGIIDDLIGTELTSLEVKIDEGNYRSLTFTETSQGLPAEGAVSVDFDISVKGLPVGEHKVCVRATGTDSLGSVSQVEDCHNVMIEAVPTNPPTSSPTTPAPTGAPTTFSKEEEKKSVDPLLDGAMDEGSDWSKAWKIVLAVVGCVCVLAVAMHQIGRYTSGKETDRNAAEEAANALNNDDDVAIDHGIPLDYAPQVV